MGKLFFRIRPATDAELEAIDREKEEFLIPLKKSFSVPKNGPYTRTLVAVGKEKILGFITIITPPSGADFIGCFYMRKGCQGRGIGSKLLGKANAVFIREKMKRVDVWATEGSERYYGEHTNYKKSGQAHQGREFELIPKAHPRARRAR